MWIGLYTATAAVIGVALFVLAEFQRELGAPPPRRPGVSAMAAGFLWPVLVIGVLQCVLLLAVRHRLRRATATLGVGPARITHPVG